MKKKTVTNFFLGVALEISLWNTLLSVYIDNRCVDFEPVEFLSKLWETSTAEPNLVSLSLYFWNNLDGVVLLWI